jgi:hypothetical protein
MKRLILVAFLIAAPLGGCESFLTSPTVQGAAVSSTSTSVAQARSLKAAGEFYVIATHAATAALDAGYVSKADAAKMTVIEAELYKALNDGLDAEKSGNSPAAGAALTLFNANYASLAKLIPGLH